jgi:hypothetical protein
LSCRSHTLLAAARLWFVIGLLGIAAPARAVLDINDRGPVLKAGDFALRITNIGVIGNAFYDKGLSFDPSFEFPQGSGHEALNHAELWVGARPNTGPPRVSGGPLLEWRPSLDPEDRVRERWAGQPGTRRGFDDDQDGRIDEETLNGLDDDGDGLIDEDIGMPSQQILTADYRDDQPEAVRSVYSSGEQHVPLGLSVHQEAYAWSLPGYDRMAGLQFSIKNVGNAMLRDVYLGLYCDFDSRGRDEAAGHLNDRVVNRAYSLSLNEGLPSVGDRLPCMAHLEGDIPVLEDASSQSGMPAACVVPLTHTTDPLGFVVNFAFPGAREAQAAARAPRRDTTFRFTVFSQDLPSGQGGPPVIDADRYRALAHELPGASQTDRGDYAVLVSCGPFATLAPGQTVAFAVAFVVGPAADSLPSAMANAAYIHHGRQLNLLPDSTSGIGRFYVGETGINGHEVCYEPPAGVAFSYDPDCTSRYVPAGSSIDPRELAYSVGHCVWTNFDCDECTGNAGADTTIRWLDPGTVPPAPAFHVSASDKRVEIAWDNAPELALQAGSIVAPTGFSFGGYRIYRLSDWRHRASILPPRTQWALIGAFENDTLNGALPLAGIRDSSLAPDGLLFGLPHYRIGRYKVTDREVLDGFDYLYVVTTVAERRSTVNGHTRIERIESPLVASIDSVVVPHAISNSRANATWVVPNPYRAHAPWDRPPVPGDPFGRHIDFMGLPTALCTIRIYTVAGDFVSQVDHDGRSGDGQAPWDLISRNGQDVESGVYLFTVDSSLGHQVGRFVLIR